MTWKCSRCQAAFEIIKGATIDSCPQCGAKSEIVVPIPPLDKVQPEDDKIVCPDCKMTYQKNCWNDNHGCTTYGCRSAPSRGEESGTASMPPVFQNSNVSGGIVCPQCHTQLAAGIAFCWSCGRRLDSNTAADLEVPLAGAWTRWGARLIDYWLEVTFVAFFMGMIWDISSMSDVILGIIYAPFAFLLDSAVYAIFKNTLGKWLFGIKVIESSGVPVSSGRYFYRNLRVYWEGYGLAIPIATLCTSIIQYNRVSKGNPATYDKILNLKSVRPNASETKTFFGFILLIILILALFLMQILWWELIKR